MSLFENALTAFNLSGEHLLEALEYNVHPIDLSKNITTSQYYLKVSGLQIEYDFKKPVGKRVVDLKGEVLVYEPYVARKVYRIVGPSFLVKGGDGYTMIREYAHDIQEEMTDIEAHVACTKSIDPITIGVEKRITVHK